MATERVVEPGAVERVLRSLPEWFGIDAAIDDYVADAARLPGYAVRLNGRIVAVALIAHHFPKSAELHLIAVEQGARGQGVGTHLLSAIEDELVAAGVRLLQVRTVGPSFVHEGYEQTREFYRARGFLPLQEVNGVDWAGPTLIQVKVL